MEGSPAACRPIWASKTHQEGFATEKNLTIISGGQTGVDRAALDAARELGFPHGGWCPQGRLAEDGPIPPSYDLVETPSPDYAVRTEWNVRDSDGTLILTEGELTGGTRLTAILALRYSRPLLVIDVSSDLDPVAASVRIARWLTTFRIRVLNVAGPRESSRPGIYHRAKKILRSLLENWQPQEQRHLSAQD